MHIDISGTGAHGGEEGQQPFMPGPTFILDSRHDEERQNTNKKNTNKREAARAPPRRAEVVWPRAGR